MTVSQNSPSVDKAISALSRRVDQLERRLRAQPEQFKPEVHYSYSGPVTIASSPNFSLGIPEVAYNLVLHLTAAGSSATVVNLLKNGDAVATVTLDSGIDRVVFPLSVFYAGQDQDVGRVVTTAAGAGAVDLTVIIRFRQAPTG